MAAEPKHIGGDWYESLDPSSGRVYYANLATKETSWDYPAHLAATPSRAAPVEPAWLAREDPASGRTYYYHKDTKETTWDRPAEFRDEATSNPRTDPTPGSNANTNSNPNPITSQLRIEPTSLEAQPQDDVWRASVDPSSGKTYYYNIETRESAWERPSNMDMATRPSSFMCPPDSPASGDDSSGKLSVRDRLKAFEQKRETNTNPDQVVMAGTPLTSKVKQLQAQFVGGSNQRSSPNASSNPNPNGTSTSGSRTREQTDRILQIQRTMGQVPIMSHPQSAESPSSPNPGPSSRYEPVSPTSQAGQDSAYAQHMYSQQQNQMQMQMQEQAQAQAQFQTLRAQAEMIQQAQMQTQAQQLNPNPSSSPQRQPMYSPPEQLVDNSYRQSAIHEEVMGIPGGKARASEGGNRMSQRMPPQPSRAESSRVSQLKLALAGAPAGSPLDTRSFQVNIDTDLALDGATTQELVQQASGYPLENFAERRFNFNRKGLLNSRTTTQKMLSWKNDIISMSLMNLSREHSAEAIVMFRHVTAYMGDRPTGKPPMEHASKLVIQALTSSEDLRDEAYCQICKQTTHNPSDEICGRGWQLLAILLSCFPPSEDLKLHLAHFIASNLSSSQLRVATYAEYLLHRLFRVCRLGVRRSIPTVVEMHATVRMLRLNVRVWLVDGRFINMSVDAWVTIKEVREKVAAKLGIAGVNSSPFALFEVRGSDDERAIEDEERVMDILAMWNQVEEEEKVKRAGRSPAGVAVPGAESFKIMFKVRLFFDVQEDDLAAVEMLYIQAISDVIEGRYVCSEQDALTLAALQVQEEHGDLPLQSGPVMLLRGKLPKYLNRRFLDSSMHEARERQVLGLYSKLQGYSKQEARLSYLEYVRSWKMYGVAYFNAEPQNSRELPREVIIAINSRGFLVVDPHTKDELAEYGYGTVVTWGHSATTFVLVTGTAAHQVKSYFKTNKSKEINALVRAYVEAMVA